MPKEVVLNKEVQEVVYTLEREYFYLLLKNSLIFRFLIYCIGCVGILYSVLAYLNPSFNNVFIFYTSLIFCGLIATGLYVGKRPKKEKNTNIVENIPTKKYTISLGYEVQEFYGDAVKSGFRENKIRPLLLDAEKLKRHGLILATIGAGKSVLMKGLAEQIIVLGGGTLIIDGKGTAEFAKEIFGLAAAYGREDDFVHINFLDMDNTHKINPLLSGGALALYEILISLLEGEENEWKAKQKEFMKSILKLLVYKRDFEGLKLDFSVLAEYLTLARLVEEALAYREYAYKSVAIEDFIQFVSGSIAIDYKRFINDRSDDFLKYASSQANNSDIQGVYDASMSAQAWRGVITNLKSDYGRVFNTQNPDISMWEAVQRNKILFVTLPTMASDTTPKELGRLILGLIKGVADEKARKAKEPEIPFVVLADEVGSYVCEGFGRLMSKSRALGISCWPIFQSFAQIDTTGKFLSGQSSERQEIIGVIGTFILMKNTDPDVTKYFQDFAPKKTVMEKNYSERRTHIKGQIGAEQSYTAKEIPAFEHSEIVKMNNGEMLVMTDGEMFKAIAQAESSLLNYGKKITYEGGEVTKPLPISQYFPKRDFLKTITKTLEEIE